MISIRTNCIYTNCIYTNCIYTNESEDKNASDGCKRIVCSRCIQITHFEP